MAAIGHQSHFEAPGQHRLASVTRAGDEYQRGAMAEVPRPVFGAYVPLDPRDVAPAGLLAQHGLLVLDRFGDYAAAGHVVLVHQDEPAGDREVAIEVERDGRLGADRQLGHLIPADAGLDLAGGQIGGVDDPVQGDDLALDLTGRQSQYVFLAGLQRAASHPEQVAPEGGGDQRHRVFVRGDLATLDEDLLVERDPRGLAGRRFRRHRFYVEG